MTRHLPYSFDTADDRGAAGEQRWKVVTVDMCKEILDSNAASILDFGSGRGELLHLLRTEGYHAVGVDLDPECVRLSSRFATCYQLREQGLAGLFPPGSFDMVIALHVLEHIEDPRQAVESLKAMTKRYLILGVPNLATMTGMQFFRVKYVNEGHMHGWDFNHFRTFTELHCGLRLIRWQPDFVVVPKISALLHRLKLRPLVEERLLPRIVPYQSNSIIGLFEKS